MSYVLLRGGRIKKIQQVIDETETEVTILLKGKLLKNPIRKVSKENVFKTQGEASQALVERCKQRTTSVSRQEKTARDNCPKNEIMSKILGYLNQFENINRLPTIEQIYSFIRDNMNECVDVAMDIFLDSVVLGIDFTLQDGTNCCLTYYTYQCILHSIKQMDYEDQGGYIYSIEDGNLFICASCLSRLKECPEILAKYPIFSLGQILFPSKWDVRDIDKWCKRRI